jgi:uncharacterized protein involved in exopolysaccharide biosynthesis
MADGSRWLLSGDLSFNELYHALASRWTWLVITMLAGALAGWLSSFVIPPQYRSTASLGVGIDYGRTLPLDDQSERESWLRVQEFLLSDGVLQAAIDRSGPDARLSELAPSPGDLRELIRLDRFEGRWDLTVETPDAEASAAAANAWASAAVEGLQTAVGHAIKAAELQTALYDASCRLTYVSDLDSAAWICQSGSSEEVGQIEDALLEEIRQSKGVLPALTFAVLRQAEPDPKPVRGGLLWLILGGLVAGAALGTGAVLFVAVDKQSPVAPGDAEQDR